MFKASYGGRDMFSDSVTVAYTPNRAAAPRRGRPPPPLSLFFARATRPRLAAIKMNAKYVFKDAKGHDAVNVELYNGTPGDASSLVGKLAIDLRPLRKPHTDKAARIAIPGTKARVTLGIQCDVCQDDDDEQASCMDTPGQEGKSDGCICQ